MEDERVRSVFGIILIGVKLTILFLVFVKLENEVKKCLVLLHLLLAYLLT